MKKSVLILALGIIVLSCSKKETETQNNTSDSLTADTMTSGTVPVSPDTMTTTTIPDSAAMPKDSISTATK
ncbi:hypothetical protein AB4Y90_17815 [Chryseobacterium sp. 2TAF14]|jgi:hypothetical protein|uniref:hypothetical protein n=1 Tax=Chryseobacterium sp. 2TAF14 TaxID=3233007 RepID=UPI003F927B6D